MLSNRGKATLPSRQRRLNHSVPPFARAVARLYRQWGDTGGRSRLASRKILFDRHLSAAFSETRRV